MLSQQKLAKAHIQLISAEIPASLVLWGGVCAGYREQSRTGKNKNLVDPPAHQQASLLEEVPWVEPLHSDWDHEPAEVS